MYAIIISLIVVVIVLTITGLKIGSRPTPRVR